MEIGIVSPVAFPQYSKLTRVRYFIAGLLGTPGYLEEYKLACSNGNKVILDLVKNGWKRAPCNRIPLVYPQPSWYILPSEMYDKAKTVERVKYIINEGITDVGTYPTNIVGCLEGTSLKELKECKRALKRLGIERFALPAHCYRFGLTLDNILIYIDNWENPFEVPKIDSILVTSLPLRLGFQGKVLSNFKPTPPIEGFYSTEEDKFPKVCNGNLQEVLDYYGD